MTVVSFSMAYRSFRGGSGRLVTRLDTPPSINRRHPDSCLARETKRRQYSEALKRQIVAETLEPGSSVSIVARRHDVNSNQLFKWRRELLPKEPGAAIDG